VTVRDSLFSVAPVANGEILVVADEAMRKLVLHHVSILGLSVAQAESAERALDIASDRADRLDCVVLDGAAVGVDAHEVSRKLRAEPETAVVPTLVILGRPPNEAEMLRLLEAGIMDHVTKPLSSALFAAKVRAVCERSRMQRELKNKLRFALENAAHDPLTGLFNRRYFERRLKEESAHARRHKKPFSIVMIDLDHFKLVNDTYGHEDGDRVLKHVAEIFAQALREDDVACRYGGEEFVLLLRTATGAAARVVANRLRAALLDRGLALGDSDEPRHVTFSAGVAAADDRNDYDAKDILARADQALYRAKRGGRNRVEMD
jgi:two-component system, cell cycle response regulator